MADKAPPRQRISKSGESSPEQWDLRAHEDLEKVSREVLLGILRSLQASTFRVEKSREGTFHVTFLEGQLADELGMTTRDVFGKPVEKVFPQEFLGDLQDRFARGLKGEAQQWTTCLKERYYRFELPAAGYFAEDWVIGSVKDVTESVQTTESKQNLLKRLEEVQRQTQRMNYSLSHDLRNPLTVILSMCELAQREIEQDKGDPLVRVRKIRASAHRINEMVTDILKHSRAERVTPRVKPVDVSALAFEVLNEFASIRPEREVQWQVQPGLTVEGDPGLIRDLLENLLSNAWKYTEKEKHPEIRVEGKNRDGDRWICVRDNGIGFAEDERSGLFEPFKRLESAAGFRGTGVGLATVKRIVERHGGKLHAEGRLGEGAEFCFSIPANASDRSETDGKESGSPR